MTVLFINNNPINGQKKGLAPNKKMIEWHSRICASSSSYISEFLFAQGALSVTEQLTDDKTFIILKAIFPSKVFRQYEGCKDFHGYKYEQNTDE